MKPKNIDTTLREINSVNIRINEIKKISNDQRQKRTKDKLEKLEI